MYQYSDCILILLHVAYSFANSVAIIIIPRTVREVTIFQRRYNLLNFIVLGLVLKGILFKILWTELIRIVKKLEWRLGKDTMILILFLYSIFQCSI